MRLITILSVLIFFQAANAGRSGSIPDGSPVPKNSNCSVAAKPAGDRGVACKLQLPAPRAKPICSSPHGAHFRGPLGTDVLATGTGVVEKVGSNDHLGNYVIINHGPQVKTSYGHLEMSTVSKGQRVSLGETIGKIGKSGSTSSPGLHYMITQGKRALDPLQFIANRTRR